MTTVLYYLVVSNYSQMLSALTIGNNIFLYKNHKYTI